MLVCVLVCALVCLCVCLCMCALMCVCVPVCDFIQSCAVVMCTGRNILPIEIDVCWVCVATSAFVYNHCIDPPLPPPLPHSHPKERQCFFDTIRSLECNAVWQSLPFPPEPTCCAQVQGQGIDRFIATRTPSAIWLLGLTRTIKQLGRLKCARVRAPEKNYIPHCRPANTAWLSEKAAEEVRLAKPPGCISNVRLR